MEKLRHRKGYYKGCYTDIESKSWSCGETMVLKDALDLWWNSVRVRTEDGVVLCYKNAYTCDEPYTIGDLPKSALAKLVKLDDSWDEDADGYPIVYAEFVSEK